MKEMTNYKLESVGTLITSDGWTYPMMFGGGYDSENGVHVDDIAPDEDWFDNLSATDWAIVKRIRGPITSWETWMKERTQ
jgi:hypothetical protein